MLGEEVMRSAVIGLSRGTVCAVALMGWMYSPQPAAANDDAAHALAEKFSQAADEGQRAEDAKAAKLRAKAQVEAARRKADEQRASDEAEMLRNANDEAQARRKHDEQVEQAQIEAERQAARADAQRMADEAQKARVEQEHKAEEARRAEAARLSREVEEQRVAEEKRLDDERRVAAEKKAEEARLAEAARVASEAEERRIAEAKRKAEETRVAEEKRKADAKADAARQAEVAREAEAHRVAEEKRKQEDARIAEQQRIDEAKAGEQRAALEAQRQQEAQRIAEKFRLAREERERNKEARSSLGGPMPGRDPQPSPFFEAPVTAQATYPARVTVLIVMRPRPHGFGGVKMTANPVLCVGQSCYVSGGAGSAATMLSRAQALGPGNTLGRNAGPCRNQTTCVFRDVTLADPLTTIQPVDMGFLRHDRRETRTVEPDRSCDVSGRQLYCSAPVVSSGYRAWIVPEIVAEKAGPHALEQALADGLPLARSASYDGWGSTVQALPTR
jgi:hypothetical protein